MSRKKKKKQQKKPFEPIPRERALVVMQPPVWAFEEKKEEIKEVIKEKPKEEPQKEPKRKDAPQKKKRGRRAFGWIAAAMMAALLGAGVWKLDVVHWQMLEKQKLEGLSQTSRLYDRNGDLITRLSGEENRTRVSLSQIPKHVQNAFIAAEDLRFWQHNGFDAVRIFGALASNLKAQNYAQGASTISQQLVKLTHLTGEKTLARKAEELWLSIQLEMQYEKDEILEMYLNTVYFGQGAYGIQAAAETFFGKDAGDLTAAEGAALAASIKAPSIYGLAADEKKNQNRREYILGVMRENGMLSAEEAEEALLETVGITGAREKANVRGWFVDAALEEAEEILGITPDELLSGGYYIETTMDPFFQAAAQALYENKNYFPENASDGTPAQSAMAVTDVKTGALLAVIGGREYTVQRGLNRATDMRRQPGSAIKPLAVYAPAIAMGYTTASVVSDERQDFGGGYNPRNAGEVYHGNVTLRRALALSMNVATVRLMSQIGVQASRDFLKKAGIPLDENDANLSLALGAMTRGVTPAEMAASYGLFANGGVYHPGYMISRISAWDGTLVYEHQSEPRQVLSAQEAYLLTSMMQSVTGWGTGTRLSQSGVSTAGKTGTVSLTGQSGNRDIWMCAYTQDYSLAVWMGFDETDSAHKLPSWQSGGGATATLAAAFLKKAYEGKEKPSFQVPDGLVWVTIDTAATAAGGRPLLAGNNTPSDYRLSEVFLETNRPWQTSALWQAPGAVSYFYVDEDSSGAPKLVIGCGDSATYRIERVQGERSEVLTEMEGLASQTLTYVDYTFDDGQWYTYRVTPLSTRLLQEGVVLAGPSASQSVQARWASGFWRTIAKKVSVPQ